MTFYICPVCEADLEMTTKPEIVCDQCRNIFQRYTLAEFSKAHGVHYDVYKADAITVQAANDWLSRWNEELNREVYDLKTVVKGLEKRLDDMMPVENNDFGPEPD